MPDDINEYEINEKHILGKGSYAQVFPATYLPSVDYQNDKGHQVAIKVYTKFKLLTDMCLRQNLKKEIKILTRFSKLDNEGSKHMLKLHESIETLDKIFLVMELLEGEPMSKHIKNITGNKYSTSHAVEILRQLLTAVDSLHHNQIAHRDIKLENVIYDSQFGTVKLIDFGFSTYCASPLFQSCGSLMYMAPELFDRAKEF